MEKPNIVAETNSLISQQSQFSQPFSLNGRLYWINPGVFSPIIFPATAHYANTIPVVEGGSFLEIGAGSGVVTIEGLNRGFATATATDLTTEAVDNIRSNARSLGVADRVNVFQSDVFDQLPSGQYDTIFWAMPFGYRSDPLESPVEQMVFDHEYRSIARYFRDGPRFLKTRGRLLFGFSQAIGSEDVLDRILLQNGLKKELLQSTTLTEVSSVDFGLYQALKI